jgi:hypothetical protein
MFKNFGEENKDILKQMLKNADLDLQDSDSEDSHSNSSSQKIKISKRAPGRPLSLIELLIEGSMILMSSKSLQQSKMAGLKIGSYLQFAFSEDLQNQLISLMTLEDNEEIRKSAVYNLDINPQTLAHFLKRLKDKKEAIRKEVLNKIKRKRLEFGALTLKQRYNLLDDGIRARDPAL